MALATSMEISAKMLSGQASTTESPFSYDEEGALSRQIENMTETFVEDVQLLQHILVYCIGAIVAIGLCGNLSCIVYFSHTKQRHRASNQFLFALIVADFLFLVSLLVSWLNSLGVHLYDTPIVCEMTNYTSYVFSCLSSWFIVGLTFERFFVIYYPLRRDVIAHPFRTRVVILTMTFVACVLNVWVPISHEVVALETPMAELNGSGQSIDNFACTQKKAPIYESMYMTMNTVDTVTTFIVPASAIFILNVLIVFKLFDASTKRQRLTGEGEGGRRTVLADRLANGANAIALAPLLEVRPQLHRHLRPIDSGHGRSGTTAAPIWHRRSMTEPGDHATSNEMRITKTLLLISSTYLVLNLPSYLFRFVNAYVSIMTQSIMSFVAYTLFYSQYGVNFVLYALSRRAKVANAVRKLCGRSGGGRSVRR